jgi:hypothetical protein
MGKIKIGIIGGGAAGFFAAIEMANQNPTFEISIFERGANVLEKVKISGGGRCNVTNACFDPKELIQFYPRGGKSLLNCFYNFQPKDTIDWFQKRGVPLKIEADNRVFPISNLSQSIIDVLVKEAQNNHVIIKTSTRINDIQFKNKKWELIDSVQNLMYFDQILIACGSSNAIWKSLEKLGHTINDPVPSLFTFNIQHAIIQNLMGISVKNVAVKINDSKFSSSGPLLITHWGLSGPAILKLSAWGANILNERQYHFNIDINWTPQFNGESIKHFLQQTKLEWAKKGIYSNNPFEFPGRLWENILKSVEIGDKKWADLNKNETQKLSELITKTTFQVKGKSTNKDEFVTCGGISLKEVNFKTMESKLFPGLFFAGEVLDIDALTGGYNFQAAWTTGWIAGQNIGKNLI